MISDPVNRVLALRQLLRERFPAAHPRSAAEATPPPPPPDPDGDPAPVEVDFSPGEIYEVVAEQPNFAGAQMGCGGALLIGDLLNRSGQEGRILVLVDGKDSFDPDSFDEAQCRQLLWLRCRDASQALQATDLLLRDGNLPTILLDLQLNPLTELQSLPPSTWHRFRGLAEQSGVALLVLTPAPIVTSAHRRFTLQRRGQPSDLDMPRELLSARSRPILTRRRKFSRRLSA